MTEPTDADRQRAVDLLRSVCVGAESTTVAIVAAALAEERERARAPFLALADRYEASYDRAPLQRSDYIAELIRRASEETTR